MGLAPNQHNQSNSSLSSVISLNFQLFSSKSTTNLKIIKVDTPLPTEDTHGKDPYQYIFKNIEIVSNASNFAALNNRVDYFYRCTRPSISIINPPRNEN